VVVGSTLIALKLYFFVSFLSLSFGPVFDSLQLAERCAIKSLWSSDPVGGG
jgi:hypothetical protein